MKNTEAISLIEELKSELEWDLSLEYKNALDMAITSLKLDEIGLTETVKEIHDGVYKQGFCDGIEECIKKIKREHPNNAYYNVVYEAIILLEQLKE